MAALKWGRAATVASGALDRRIDLLVSVPLMVEYAGMRSVIRCGSLSRRLAARISESLNDRMGESASSITITHGPDSRDAGTQLIIDHDVTAFV
jgi:hypothetical protein